jgi:hypothetical protein
MADNTELNAGTGGDTIATDDIGGVKHQRVKLSVGADGAASDAIPVSNGLDTAAAGVQAVGLVGQLDDAATGAVTENQFAPVRISSRRALLVEGVASGTAVSVSGPVTNAGTFVVQENGAALTALQLLDDAVFAEDVAAQAADKGIAVLAVRRDADTSLVGADNDYANLQVNNLGALKVEAFSGETLPVSLASVPSHAVTNAGTFLVQADSVIPGTGATNLGKAEDAAHASSDVGVMALAVRAAAPTERSAGPTDGDYEPLGVNEVGALWVSVTPSANGGATTLNSTSSDGGTALTSTVQAIKASAGSLKGYYIYNPNATAQFVQFYNTASGSVTVGTTNPLFMLTIPATSAANLWMPDGIAFATAISWAATSTAGGNGAPGTAMDAVAWYK